MFDYLILAAIAATIYAIVRWRRSHVPKRENTHHYTVTLQPHNYRLSKAQAIESSTVKPLILGHRLEFLWHSRTDALRRPQGALVSWHGSDSHDWYDLKGRFKNRNRPRSGAKGAISDPIGWTQRYVTKDFELVKGKKTPEDLHLFERGHLIPYWVTQDQVAQTNLVPLTQYTNKGFEGGDASSLAFGSINAEAMLSVETEFRKFVIGQGWRQRLKPNDIFQMYVKPIYVDDSYVPYQINYYFQLVTTGGQSRSFVFHNHTVPKGQVLSMEIPVQLSNGTIPKIQR